VEADMVRQGSQHAHDQVMQDQKEAHDLAMKQIDQSIAKEPKNVTVNRNG
jgi:hypothetical protein